MKSQNLAKMVIFTEIFLHFAREDKPCPLKNGADCVHTAGLSGSALETKHTIYASLLKVEAFLFGVLCSIVLSAYTPNNQQSLLRRYRCR